MNHHICSPRFRIGATKAKIAMDNNLSEKKKRIIFSPYNILPKHLGRKNKKMLKNVFDHVAIPQKRKKKRIEKRKTKQKATKRNKKP